jgi:hypothetical protein
MPSHTAAAGRPGQQGERGTVCRRLRMHELTVVAASSNEDVGMVKKIEHYQELVDLQAQLQK